MNNADLLQCALGVHRFDEKIIGNLFLCSICKRAKHLKGTDGYEYWEEYDEKGNMIHYKNSEGNEYWKEYDERGNMIHYRNSCGDEWWFDHDEKGNEIYSRSSRH